MKIKICIFSGNRAEYGLLKPIIEKIKKNKKFLVDLLISGAHLEKDYGKTINEIKKDGFRNFFKVSLKNKFKKDHAANSKVIGLGVIRISNLLAKIKPDIFLVYADRFEGFSAVIASTQMNIPTIHVEGGDITEGGALDDNVRHAMTKLSHIHLTTNNEASQRILAMGEEKWRVAKIGYPALDMIKKNFFATEKEIIKKFSLKNCKNIILFTQHSITTEHDSASYQFQQSLKALKKISKKNVRIIITFPNNDIGGDLILKIISKDLNKFRNIMIFSSIGRYYYHGILALAKKNSYRIVCAGNSSSGIKETPIFKCPVVNIGSRQLGRLRGTNVIDVDYDSNKIYLALNKALYNKKFILNCKKTFNPYGGGNSAFIADRFISRLTKNKKKLLVKKMMLKKEYLEKIKKLKLFK